MNQELKKMAFKYGLNYLGWGIEGGNGWIWYKQEDEKRYKVQIFTLGKFNDYKNIKTDIVNLFISKNCSLLEEQDLGVSSGYKKTLFFMDTDELRAQNQKKEEYTKRTQAPTYVQINARGSIVTLGDVINSTQNIDNSIQQVEKLIEEKGGDDKEELYSTLKEAQKIIAEIYNSKEIRPNKSFIEKLNNHLSKHSWFYSAIVNLLGTALITALG